VRKKRIFRMQPSFIGGCRETFPDAIMVFDHFHVIKLLNDTINRIRLDSKKTLYFRIKRSKIQSITILL